jgi:AraC-like DNA-binding protein
MLMPSEAGTVPAATPLLERHRIFHSCHVDEARSYLQSKQFQLDISPRHAGDLDVHINGVYLPGMWLGYFGYGPPVTIRAVGRDDYWVQFPLGGPIEIADASSSVICDTRRAAVLSPTRTDFYRVRSSIGCGRLSLSFTQANLVEQLAALLGESPTVPLYFASTVDLTMGYGRSLARYVRTAVEDLEQAGSLLWGPTAMSAFEQFVMTALLMSHPHNYSEALRRLGKPIAPRDVRRALDYIEARLDQPITVADLVEATGVAGRTLFMHFKAVKGVSPMRYVRDARLRQVRQALLEAAPEASVTSIATDAGFTHLGRFSMVYRRRFGESPSETLKSRRRARLPS